MYIRRYLEENKGEGNADHVEPAGGAEPEVKTEPAWPDDWRERLAGEDDKLLKRASRYQDPQAVFKALISAQNRISSGELKPVLSEKASDEEIAEWRQAHGIPDKPDGYDVNIDGLVIGEEDKEVVNGFLERAHNSHMTPEQVKNTIQWYYEDIENQAEQQRQIDEQQRLATVDDLNIEWGKDYRKNINMIESVLNMFPKEVADLLREGRLSDGTGIFNSKAIMKGFADIAYALNPAGPSVPGDDANQLQSIEEEIKSIEKLMRENRQEYNRDTGKQERLQQLYSYRDNLKKRSA